MGELVFAMFSVIIPLYNKSYYILKAVYSVLGQTYKEFELIIVNDGSTDHSLEIVKNISDDRIKIIDQENSGVSTARNNGVKAARFEYIAFLDADDWWDNNFLNEMKLLIEECPEAGLYASNYYVVKNKQKKQANIGVDEIFLKGYIDYFNAFAKTFWVPINCSFVIVRRDVFLREKGFKPTLKFGEDFDLWVRIALLEKAAYLNKHLAYSNQDVSAGNRALGDKIWKMEEHVIFNLDYLKDEELKRPDLKFLLDGIRVRSLIKYYLNGIYKVETESILSTVDMKTQPCYYQRIYSYPKYLVKFYFSMKRVSSRIKQSLIKTKLYFTTNKH